MNGRRLVRLSADLTPRIRHTYWVDTERGHTVVRQEVTGPNTDKGLPDFRSMIDVEPTRDEVSGAWYFRSYTTKSVFYSKNDSEETAVVKTLEVNRGVDPAVFTWAGLKIPSGTFVMRGPAGKDGEQYWDGTKLVGKREYQRRPDALLPTRLPALTPTSATPPPATGPVWWQYALVAVLGAAGLLAVIRAVRR